MAAGQTSAPGLGRIITIGIAPRAATANSYSQRTARMFKTRTRRGRYVVFLSFSSEARWLCLHLDRGTHSQSILQKEERGQESICQLTAKDLKRSMNFFSKLGFTFNAQFTDTTAACIIVSEDIYVMLLTQDKFKSFTPKQICDATKNTEVLVCLSSESRDEVNELVRKAVAAGGTTYKEPQDQGFMYGHGFQDLDGHIWELAYMDPAAIKQS